MSLKNYIVNNLCEEYAEAWDMTVEVGSDSPGCSISPTDLQTWEKEISNAESNCHIDHSVMDIIGARTSHNHGHVDTAKESACGPVERW